MLSNGERIAANTVILAAGVRAHPLTEQIPGERDGSGRVIGDAFLRAGGGGHFRDRRYGEGGDRRSRQPQPDDLPACDEPWPRGRPQCGGGAGGLPTHPYSQPKYVTCLDLGPWGALYTEGWERQVRFTRQEGKR